MVSVCRFGLKVMDGGGFAASLDEFSKAWAIYFPDLSCPLPGRTPIRNSEEAHIWHTKRYRKTNLRSVLEQVSLMWQISNHQIGWAPSPGK
jgi:hypothetical protein